MNIQQRTFDVDKSLIEKCLEVSTGTIGHYVMFGIMCPGIKPVYEGVKIAGPALTLRVPSLDSTVCHYVMELVRPGDVLVIDRCGDQQHAAVGEMVAFCAKNRGAAAIIIDGVITDVSAIRAMKMPVYARGVSSLATRLLGIEGEINTDVQCGGVIVHPGDIVLGDDDGVVVIPPAIADEVITKAKISEEREVTWRKELASGRLLGDLSGASDIVRNLIANSN